MKKTLSQLALLCSIVLCAASAWAQLGNLTQQYGAGAPSGNCPNKLTQYLDTPNGNLYTCPVPGAPWVLSGGGASGVTSVFTRTGAVVANTGDYTCAEVTGCATGGFPTNGLLAQYDFNEGSGTVLTDLSGNGNNGALCAGGAAPTWNSIASGGGLVFTSASSTCVTLPAALNASGTIILFLNYAQSLYTPVGGGATYFAPIAGNGTAANTAALVFNEPGNLTGFGGVGNDGTNTTFSWAAGFQTGVARSVGQGTFMLTWVLDASADQIYSGPWLLPTEFGGHSAGNQTSGVYQLGGRAAGYINSNTSFWGGTMYAALFYNRELGANEIAQAYQALSSSLLQRGIIPQYYQPVPNNYFAVDGDSIPGASGGAFQYIFLNPTGVTNVGGYTPAYLGQGGFGIQDLLADFPQVSIDSWIPSQLNSSSTSGAAILDVQIGTNNAGSSVPTFMQRLEDYSRARRLAGWNKIFINTLIDNNQHAGVAAISAAERELYPRFADVLVDLNGDVNLGCNGCNLGAYFADPVHPSALGQYEIGWILQKNLNRAAYGNFNWSTANLYTTGAPAATTITAASESGNTATFTFSSTPAAFTTGTDLTIAGMTPSGYNTAATNICHLLTSGGTTVTCLNSATGLGAGSGFGTAAAPLMQDIDAYVRLGGSAASPSFTLESCMGWTQQTVTIKNENTTSPWVLTPFQSETIDGASSLTMPPASSGIFPVVVLQSYVSGPGSGCVWKSIQTNVVASVFGRTGPVTAAANDYNFNQLAGTLGTGQVPTGGSSSNFLNAAGTYTAPAGAVPSVFGRTGAVTATSGDYTCAQVTGCPTTANVASVSNSDGTLTISPTTGAVVASIALGHANTWTGVQTFNLPLVVGSVGGTGGSIQYLGTTSGNVQPGCVPASTCTSFGSGSAPASYTKYNTTTNCGANGTAANPSVVSCGSAGAGSISCSVSASTGTCTVNDTAVTANSNIILTPVTYVATRLAVTCNATSLTGAFVSAVSAGTSFTITLPAFTNSDCFTFQILN